MKTIQLKNDDYKGYVNNLRHACRGIVINNGNVLLCYESNEGKYIIPAIQVWMKTDLSCFDLVPSYICWLSVIVTEKMTGFVSFRHEKQIRLKPHNMEEDNMREHYDFSNGIKNPYADRLKKQITIRLDDQVIEYFKNMAEETGMPYQNIINYYLLDCVKEKKHLEVAFSK